MKQFPSQAIKKNCWQASWNLNQKQNFGSLPRKRPCPDLRLLNLQSTASRLISEFFHWWLLRKDDCVNISYTISEVYSESCQTSKIEYFAKIICRNNTTLGMILHYIKIVTVNLFTTNVPMVQKPVNYLPRHSIAFYMMGISALNMRRIAWFGTICTI